MSQNAPHPEPEQVSSPRISEDWLAVILAFGIILLSALGILGESGLNISF